MKHLKDIPYRSPQDEAHLLDAWLPENPSGDLFFYLHGGGLETGDKADIALAASYLNARGIAVVSANYRMYPSARYPEFIEDSAAALAFVKQHLADYQAERIYVGGSSAGGYLSMMLCFDPGYLSAHGMSNEDIAGYFHDAGQPTAHFRVLKERAIDGRRVIVDDTCPLFHVGALPAYPPMRFVVSDRDLQNRYEQTVLTLSTLRHFGFEKADMITVHGGHCAYIGKTDENGQSVFGQMILDFIQSLR